MRKRRITVLIAVLSVSLTMLAGTGPAAGDGHENFNRISTFSVYTNNGAALIGEETVAEIVAGCTDSWTTPRPPWRGTALRAAPLRSPRLKGAAGGDAV